MDHEQPAYTSAGSLPCKYVIYAVGPIWGSGDEESKLALAISGALALAEKLKLEKIAMPPISTGIFGFPKEIAAPIFFEQVAAFFIAHLKSSLQLVRITILDGATLQVFKSAFTSWVKLQPPKA